MPAKDAQCNVEPAHKGEKVDKPVAKLKWVEEIDAELREILAEPSAKLAQLTEKDDQAGEILAQHEEKLTQKRE